MSLFTRLGKMFSGGNMPDEAKAAFENSENTKDLLKKLDKVSTVNEVEMKGLEKQMLKLGEIETSEIDKVRAGKQNDVAKRLSLMEIKRLRKKQENLTDRLNIYDRNITLHLNLIGKIQQMEAMQLRGVSSEEIDDVIMDFEANFETYTEALAASEDFEAHASKVEADQEALNEIEKEVAGVSKRKEQDKELTDLENEIMGKKDEEKEKPTEEEGLMAE